MREDRVLRPNGTPGIYGVVEMKVATGVVAITAEQDVVLVGQWRYTFGQYSWEIIEGAAEPGEPPEHAAARELREEAGLRAKRWRRLGEPLALSNSVTNEVAYIYLAEGLTSVPVGTRRNRTAEDPQDPFHSGGGGGDIGADLGRDQRHRPSAR